MKHKCVRCGWPCEAALFSTSVNCTNPKCPFYLSELDAETRKLMTDLEKACDELRRFA